MSDESTNAVQNKVIKKYIDENTAIKVDENGNAVGGDQESNKINESGILNSLEGRNNSIGISMIPSIKGSIYETNTIIVNEYNSLYISPIRFDDFVYYNKIVNNNGVYTYTVYQASPKIITDNKGNYQNDSDDINYDNIVKIEFYNGDILFEFEFTDTEKYDFIISNGESFSFSKGEIILAPDTAMFTGMVDGVNFSYANGYQNTALSSGVHITGDSNIVGARAYQILESNKSESTYKLDSVIGLETGDIYSIKLSANYDNWGRIDAVYPESKTVKVDTFIDKPVTASSSFRIASKPWLGTTNWASYARSSGVLNRVHGDAASADGRSNIITGRYGRASGYLNKTGYAGHVQNRSNTALGIDASGSGRDTVADGERSFTMGHGTVAKAKDQLARGKYNIPDNGQNYADIVGNGKDDNNRSNAYTLDWNGNGWFAGSITTEGIITTSDIELPYLKEIIIKGNTVINEELKESSGSIIQTINIDNSTIIDLSDKNIELSSTLKYNDQLIVNDKKISVIKNIRKLTIDSRFGKYWKQATAKSSSGGRTFSKRFYIDINSLIDSEGNTLLTPEELEIFNKGEMVFFTDSGYSSHFSTYTTTKSPYNHGRFNIDQTANHIRISIFDTNATNILVSADDESIYHEIGSIEIPEGEYDIRTESIDFYFGIVSPKTIDIRDVNTEEWNNIINQYNYDSDIDATVNLEFSNGKLDTILNANVTLEYLTDKLAKIENSIRENQNNNIIDIDIDNNCTFPANVEAKGDIIAKDVFVEKCNTGLNIHGKVEIEKSGTVYSPSAITDILIDNKSILNETVEIQPLYAAKNYADTLCIKDTVVQEHGVRRVVLGEHIKKDSSWVHSRVSSTETCNYFYIELQTAKDNNNVPILTEEEVSLLPTFIKKDDAKCLWSVNNNGFEELLQTTKKMEIDGSFYIDQTDTRLKIWFASMVGEDYSNITTVDDMRKVPIELYLVLENPVSEKLDNKFIEVWDNFNKYYTSNSNIEILYQNSEGVIRSLSYSIDHSISSAIDSLTRRISKLDTLTAIETWEDVRNAVRLGYGAALFPVGYEFTMKDSVTGADITWVVRGHDNHIAANRKLTHTMTLETKYIYSSASGAGRAFDFDATEALYYAAEGLRAGTYNFTLPTGYNKKTLSFTLTKPVPAGGVIMFPWGDKEQSTDTKISTYASNAATEAIEIVAVTASAEGTSLGVVDGTVENLNHMDRVRYGSNNYAQSAVRQWLNSDAAAGGVWSPTNIFDRPPSWNTSYSGFMRGLPAAFLAVVQPAAIPCRTNSIFEVNSLDGTKFDIDQVYTLKDKFFLLSRPEIYGTWDNPAYKDGMLLEFYNGLTDAEYRRYSAVGDEWVCWLRSPHPGYGYSERTVRIGGMFNYNRTKYAYGVAPACIIA